VTDAPIEVRRATPDDAEPVLEMLAVALGWGSDPIVAQLFAWKHSESIFGPSPAWVATSEGRVVGYRTFMRWTFLWAGEPVEAVRAVDTATHPDFRGRGLFRLLTTRAVEDLRDEGVGFVFNTPNDQSRPGYLKMGWQVVGRLPVAAQASGPGGLLRMTRARQPAELWSQPTTVGVDPVEFFGSAQAPTLQQGDDGALRTRRHQPYLAWRYGFMPLHYRVWCDDRSGSALVFRLRRRGAATELALLEAFGTAGLRAVNRLLAATGADYAIGLAAARPRAGLPLPNQGPLLTWRALARTDCPPLEQWHLSLGDVELF
jgi:GNAT superfamily N-acetyltransferase